LQLEKVPGAITTGWPSGSPSRCTARLTPSAAVMRSMATAAGSGAGGRRVTGCDRRSGRYHDLEGVAHDGEGHGREARRVAIDLHGDGRLGIHRDLGGLEVEQPVRAGEV